MVEDFYFRGVTLIDSGAELNCIKEGIIPIEYCVPSSKNLCGSDGSSLDVSYKLKKHFFEKKFCKRFFLLKKKFSGKNLFHKYSWDNNFKFHKSSINYAYI